MQKVELFFGATTQWWIGLFVPTFFTHAAYFRTSEEKRFLPARRAFCTFFLRISDILTEKLWARFSFATLC